MLGVIIPLVTVTASLQAKQVSATNSRCPHGGLQVLTDFLSIWVGIRCFETLAGCFLLETAMLLPVDSQTKSLTSVNIRAIGGA